MEIAGKNKFLKSPITESGYILEPKLENKSAK